MHGWAQDLFPITRSLTGDGVRKTLHYLRNLVPQLDIHEIPSGTSVLDWTVPDEWRIDDAFIADATGKRLVDFRANNLHVVGYSEPVDRTMTRDELEPHLHSLPQQPNAIPYVTAYYARTWGFCLSELQRSSLGTGPFTVSIRSTLSPGHLTFADAVIPGKSSREVLFSTYICHPSMGNNELSGPVVTAALARYVAAIPNRKYTYRFVLVPETIGAIAYLAKYGDHLRQKVVAGWQVTCIGDERTYSFLPSRNGKTLPDRISRRVLRDITPEFHEYTFLDRGSDERQWCSPGLDLPVCSIMRSKYGTYPEYHTSLDDLTLITPVGLSGGFNALRACVDDLETTPRWRAGTGGEPQLGRRGLYPNVSRKGSADGVKSMMDILAYCDGTHTVKELCELTQVQPSEAQDILLRLEEAGVISLD